MTSYSSELLVAKTALAENSRLHAVVGKGDFLDCYTVQIHRAGAPISEIAQRLFLSMPRWIRSLLAVRDLAVAPFGLKTTAMLPKTLILRRSIDVGDRINFFCVQSLSEDEVILGEDDSHLDFKISVYRERRTYDRISLATWVRTHNLLGQIYLRAVTPFHVRVVNSSLTDLAKHYAR